MFFRFLNRDRRSPSGHDRVMTAWTADVKRLRFVTVSSKSKLGRRANIFMCLFPSIPRLSPLVVNVVELKTKSGKKRKKMLQKPLRKGMRLRTFPYPFDDPR